MALAECNTTVDSRGRELLQHGTTAFPIACYHDDFSKMDVPWHWHEELEAVVISAGSCTVAAGNEKRILRAGEGFFINSGILHAAWDDAETGCRFHSLVFHPRLVGGSLDSVFHQRYIQPLLDHPALDLVSLSPDIPWQKAALEAIEAAWQNCSAEPAAYEFRVRSALSELVWQLHRNLPPVHRSDSGKTIRDAERIKAMLAFIHEHFSAELTTRRIASSAAISDSEALRCFRATIGTSPIRYVKQYRIQQAAQQLTETDDKVSEIAARCGFQDMSYFTKTFREEMSCTPSEYRSKTANR